jgi:hypothetical protein
LDFTTSFRNNIIRTDLPTERTEKCDLHRLLENPEPRSSFTMSSKDDSIARPVGENNRMCATAEETDELEKTNANRSALLSHSLTSCEYSQSLPLQHVLEDQDKLGGWPEGTTQNQAHPENKKLHVTRKSKADNRPGADQSARHQSGSEYET